MVKSQFQPLGNPAFICLLLALATLAVYLPVRNYGFVDYDDPFYFIDNPHVLGGLTLPNIKWAFTSGEDANWHPLTWLSLMLDTTLFGQGAAAAPHIINILLHAANSILVFWLLLRTTGKVWRSAAVAMLFAVHPLHVESVAWVSERKDVLSTFFGLLTLLCYARYAANDGPQRNESTALTPPATRSFSLPYWLALSFFICGLMSKPMVVTLPFVMLLLDFWPLQRFKRSSFLRLLIEKIPFFLLSVAASIVTFLVQQQGGAVKTLARIPPGARLENTFISYARYLDKIIWPVNLATPYPGPVYWPVPWVILSIAFFALLCLGAVALRKRFPFAFTGWFWFAGMLVPVIGLVQVGGTAMADRYAYLPMIGILIMMSWGIGEVCREWQPNRRVVIGSATLLFCVCALRARNQVTVWENNGTLFGHAVDVTQNNFIASLDLALWYSQVGRDREALHYYDEALRMSSNDLTALTFSTHDGLQATLSDYCNALRLNPNDPTEYYNIGNSLAKLGAWDEAIHEYRRALEINPNQPDVLDNLGFALVKEKQYASAATNFLAAVRLKPDSIGAHNNLASVLYVEGNYQDAAQQFQTALQLDPNSERICVNLAETYIRLSQTNRAVEYYQRALNLHPDDPQVIAELQKLGVHSSN